MIPLAEASRIIAPFEGRIEFMYLDVKGYVTVGVGCLLKTPQDAIRLVWRYRDDSGEPDETAIGDEWSRVSRQPAGMDAHAYKRVTSMDLIPYEIDRMFAQRVGAFETSLQHIFPEFASWPEPAQLATLDMAYNLGAGAIPKEWPNLTRALRRQEWRAAAKESHRPEAREARNLVVRGLYLEAAGKYKPGDIIE